MAIAMSVIYPLSNETLTKMGLPSNRMPYKDTLTCLVFRTSLRDSKEVERISEKVDNLPGIRDWTVDLEDWEKVLRIECSSSVTPAEIIGMLREEGVFAREMPL